MQIVRVIGHIEAHAEDYGPLAQGWVALIVDPCEPFLSPFRVCVRRRFTTPDEARALLDALTEEACLRMHEETGRRWRDSVAAREDAIRRGEPTPKWPELPDWPEGDAALKGGGA